MFFGVLCLVEWVFFFFATNEEFFSCFLPPYVNKG